MYHGWYNRKKAIRGNKMGWWGHESNANDSTLDWETKNWNNSAIEFLKFKASSDYSDEFEGHILIGIVLSAIESNQKIDKIYVEQAIKDAEALLVELSTCEDKKWKTGRTKELKKELVLFQKELDDTTKDAIAKIREFVENNEKIKGMGLKHIRLAEGNSSCMTVEMTFLAPDHQLWDKHLVGCPDCGYESYVEKGCETMNPKDCDNCVNIK